MIIQIAGTGGSGKSRLMRAFIGWAKERSGQMSTCYLEGRNVPVGYDLTGVRGVAKGIHIIGAYQNWDTGGCDTIKNLPLLMSLIREAHAQGKHVLYEGLFVMNMTRGPVLAQEVGRELAILQLTTPLTTCIAGINSRREARGEGRLLAKHNTQGNFIRAQNYCAVMAGAGARVFRITRSNGLDYMLDLLLDP